MKRPRNTTGATARLTPEDVVNKRFQSTKFREGYDQDEVDDFLDEIASSMRTLDADNYRLKQELVARNSPPTQRITY